MNKDSSSSSSEIFNIIKLSDPDALSNFLDKNESAVHDRNKKGQSALHVACDNKDIGCAEVLISRNADLNSQDKDGCTPLTCAIIGGADDIVPLLIQSGSVPGIADRKGQNALHWATRLGVFEVVECVLGECIVADKSAASKKLPAAVDKRALIFSKDAELMTPMHIAAADPSLSEIALHFVKILGDADAAVLCNTPNRAGYTPLLVACSSGDSKVVQRFFECGASLITTSNTKETCLHVAVESGDFNIVQVILSRGLSLTSEEEKESWKMFLNMCNSEGCTALYCACASCRLNIVEALLNQKFIDVNAPNSKGVSPIVAAWQKEKYSTVVASLTKRGAKQEDIEKFQLKQKEKNAATENDESSSKKKTGGDFTSISSSSTTTGKAQPTTTTTTVIEPAQQHSKERFIVMILILLVLFSSLIQFFFLR